MSRESTKTQPSLFPLQLTDQQNKITDVIRAIITADPDSKEDTQKIKEEIGKLGKTEGTYFEILLLCLLVRKIKENNPSSANLNPLTDLTKKFQASSPEVTKKKTNELEHLLLRALSSFSNPPQDALHCSSFIRNFLISSFYRSTKGLSSSFKVLLFCLCNQFSLTHYGKVLSETPGVKSDSNNYLNTILNNIVKIETVLLPIQDHDDYRKFAFFIRSYLLYQRTNCLYLKGEYKRSLFFAQGALSTLKELQKEEKNPPHYSFAKEILYDEQTLQFNIENLITEIKKKLSNENEEQKETENQLNLLLEKSNALRRLLGNLIKKENLLETFEELEKIKASQNEEHSQTFIPYYQYLCLVRTSTGPLSLCLTQVQKTRKLYEKEKNSSNKAKLKGELNKLKEKIKRLKKPLEEFKEEITKKQKIENFNEGLEITLVSLLKGYLNSLPDNSSPDGQQHLKDLLSFIEEMKPLFKNPIMKPILLYFEAMFRYQLYKLVAETEKLAEDEHLKQFEADEEKRLKAVTRNLATNQQLKTLSRAAITKFKDAKNALVKKAKNSPNSQHFQLLVVFTTTYLSALQEELDAYTRQMSLLNQNKDQTEYTTLQDIKNPRLQEAERNLEELFEKITTALEKGIQETELPYIEEIIIGNQDLEISYFNTLYLSVLLYSHLLEGAKEKGQREAYKNLILNRGKQAINLVNTRRIGVSLNPLRLIEEQLAIHSKKAEERIEHYEKAIDHSIRIVLEHLTVCKNQNQGLDLDCVRHCDVAYNNYKKILLIKKTRPTSKKEHSDNIPPTLPPVTTSIATTYFQLAEYLIAQKSNDEMKILGYFDKAIECHEWSRKQIRTLLNPSNPTNNVEQHKNLINHHIRIEKHLFYTLLKKGDYYALNNRFEEAKYEFETALQHVEHLDKLWAAIGTEGPLSKEYSDEKNNINHYRTHLTDKLTALQTKATEPSNDTLTYLSGASKELNDALGRVIEGAFCPKTLSPTQLSKDALLDYHLVITSILVENSIQSGNSKNSPKTLQILYYLTLCLYEQGTRLWKEDPKQARRITEAMGSSLKTIQENFKPEAIKAAGLDTDTIEKLRGIANKLKKLSEGNKELPDNLRLKGNKLKQIPDKFRKMNEELAKNPLFIAWFTMNLSTMNLPKQEANPINNSHTMFGRSVQTNPTNPQNSSSNNKNSHQNDNKEEKYPCKP